jgi:hypothetical protein
MSVAVPVRYYKERPFSTETSVVVSSSMHVYLGLLAFGMLLIRRGRPSSNCAGIFDSGYMNYCIQH